VNLHLFPIVATTPRLQTSLSPSLGIGERWTRRFWNGGKSVVFRFDGIGSGKREFKGSRFEKKATCCCRYSSCGSMRERGIVGIRNREIRRFGQSRSWRYSEWTSERAVRETSKTNSARISERVRRRITTYLPLSQQLNISNSFASSNSPRVEPSSNPVPTSLYLIWLAEIESFELRMNETGLSRERCGGESETRNVWDRGGGRRRRDFDLQDRRGERREWIAGGMLSQMGNRVPKKNADKSRESEMTLCAGDIPSIPLQGDRWECKADSPPVGSFEKLFSS